MTAPASTDGSRWIGIRRPPRDNPEAFHWWWDYQDLRRHVYGRYPRRTWVAGETSVVPPCDECKADAGFTVYDPDSEMGVSTVCGRCLPTFVRCSAEEGTYGAIGVSLVLPEPREFCFDLMESLADGSLAALEEWRTRELARLLEEEEDEDRAEFGPPPPRQAVLGEFNP